MEEKKTTGVKSFLCGVFTAFLALGILYFVGMWLPLSHSPGKPDSFQAQKKIKEIERCIDKHYLGEIDEQKQTDYMYLGLVAGLEDKYSTYYTKEQYEKIRKSQEGTFVGIGITILQESEGGKLKVVECMEDSPAARADVRAGDVIESIDGVSTEGMTSSQAVELIQKSKEDTLVIVLSREGETSLLTKKITKDTVEMKSVEGRLLEDQVGYIRIIEFTGVTAAQFQTVYKDLMSQGIQSLVIDLRDNPGGLVDGVCDTLSQILPEGIMVYTEDKYGNRRERTCKGETPIQIPMAVLVNEKSASASEIFAGAVKDYGVGTLVGTTTYGKGIVQNSYELSDGSVVKLTISHYYTPKGNDIHGTGITPDVEVSQPKDSGADVQLEKALEVLKGNL